MAKLQCDTPLVKNAPNKKERKEQKKRTNVQSQKEKPKNKREKKHPLKFKSQA
jgi:hypothetical protein